MLKYLLINCAAIFEINSSITVDQITFLIVIRLFRIAGIRFIVLMIIMSIISISIIFIAGVLIIVLLGISIIIPGVI